MRETIDTEKQATLDDAVGVLEDIDLTDIPPSQEAQRIISEATFNCTECHITNETVTVADFDPTETLGDGEIREAVVECERCDTRDSVFIDVDGNDIISGDRRIEPVR